MSGMLLVTGFLLLVVVLPNAVALTALAKIHPQRRRILFSIATICNLFWLVVPFWFRSRGLPVEIFLRSVLGPPWFTWWIFTVLVTTFVTVLVILWVLFFRSRPFAEFAHLPSLVFLLLLGAGLITGIYTALVPIDVRNVVIRRADLPPGLDGTRIALLSDLHVGLFSRPSRLHRYAQVVRDLHPDVVFLSGDLVDDDAMFVPKLLEGLSSLPQEIPKIAVLGNHEMYGEPFETIRRMKEDGIDLLVNRGADLRIRKGRMWVAGISDFAGTSIDRRLAPSLPEAVAGRPAGEFTILLAHQPRAFQLAKQASIPITLCGHSHGGQFGFRRLHWSLAGVFLPYHMGLYHERGSDLYVNTGAGYWLVPIRIGLLPEITVIELRRSAS